MKNIIILELLLALLVLLLGESLFDIRKEEFQGETLKIAYTKDIGDVDPFDSGSPMFVQDWVYEGLVGMQNGKAVPKLAESWEITDDGKNYIFHLRKDVFFSNGKPLTSQIVKENISELIAKREQYGFSDILKKISKIETPDAHTVIFRLDEVCSSLLNELSFTRPLTIHFSESGKEGNEVFYGTGRWILKKNIRNQYALFERNENYWGEKPKFKYVKVSIIPEVSTIENALRSGDADMYVDQDGALSFEEAFNLQQEGFSVGITPLSQIVLIALNTEKIREIPIRKALALGTDKRGVIQFLAEGKLKEAHYYWTENLPEMPPGLPYYSFDRKQADEILDKQYHRGTGPYREKDGVRLQLSLGYPAGNHNQRNLALILKDMYAKIGIDLIPDEDDFSVYLNKFRDGKYDMVLYTTWGNAYEPYSTLTEMRTDGSGFNMFQRGADDKETLFKAMKEMDSSPERESVLRYMEYINGSFYRNVLFIPLYHDYIIHVCRNDISGFVPQEDAKDRIDITHVFRQY